MSLLPRLLPLVVVSLFPVSPLFADPAADRYRKATATVAPRLVRIDTVGGFEQVDGALTNEGATTGLLLDEQGHVITSAFNFLHDPSTILIRFADGTKQVGRRIATDYNRMLALLKVGTVPESMHAVPLAAVPKTAFQPGRTVIALGRALSPDEPNLAIGILSGTDRIWGKAIQTDAAVGPNNYGGPLIDLDGRVLGILVPLSMTSTALTAGDEMYDGGVGMAVPLEDLQTIVFPKLSAGKDVYSGETGFSFTENGIFIGAPVLSDVLEGGPGDKAGLKKGDRITKLGAAPVQTAMQVVCHFQLRYSGETTAVTFLRDGKEQTVSLTTEPPEALPKRERKSTGLPASTVTDRGSSAHF